MKAEVRDDIIALNTFVEARFKYEKYITVIHEAGGYCFLNQFEQVWAKEGGLYLAKKLENAGLIKTKSYNNYKYVYLTDVSLRYLAYKDSPKDYSNKPKNMIPVKKIKNTPSEKVLFFSTIKFHLIQENELFKKSNYLIETEKQIKVFFKTRHETLQKIEEKINEFKKEKSEFEKVYHTYIKKFEQIDDSKSLHNKLETLETEILEVKNKIANKIFGKSEQEDKLKTLEKEKDIIKAQIQVLNELRGKLKEVKEPYFYKVKEIEGLESKLKLLKIQEKEIDKKVQKVMRRIIDMHDRSKIVVFLKYDDLFDNLKFEFYVLDTGTIKSPKGYYELICGLLNTLEINIQLPKQINSIVIFYITTDLAKRRRQYNKIHNYIVNALRTNRYDSSNIEVNKEYIDIKYMQNYKTKVCNKTSYIKPQDIDVFEQLRETIKHKKA